MVALGADASAAVLKHLKSEEVERLTFEMAHMSHVEPALLQSVVEEFFHRMDENDYAEQVGVDYVRDMLERAVGAEKSQEILGRLTDKPAARPFETVRSLDPMKLYRLIEGEHPQTVALILSHLPPSSAAAILSRFPARLQADVAGRVANMEAAPPDMIRRIEQAILDRLNAASSHDGPVTGGTNALLEILSQVDRSTERSIMEGLSTYHPSLADDIKGQMFAFEDIATLDGRTVQVILREVEQDDLRLALKGSTEELREVVYNNISERAAETMKEDLELMGAVRVKDVENAQKNIVGVVRRLEDAGELSVRKTQGEELIA
jgi:flagellar motor switch protein FliG